MEGRGLALLLMLIFALVFLICAFVGDILVFVALGQGSSGALIACCIITTCFIIVGTIRQIFGWCAIGGGGDILAVVICSAISLVLSVMMCVWPPLHIVASIFTLLTDVAFLVIAVLMMVGVL